MVMNYRNLNLSLCSWRLSRMRLGWRIMKIQAMAHMTKAVEQNTRPKKRVVVRETQAVEPEIQEVEREIQAVKRETQAVEQEIQALEMILQWVKRGGEEALKRAEYMLDECHGDTSGKFEIYLNLLNVYLPYLLPIK